MSGRYVMDFWQGSYYDNSSIRCASAPLDGIKNASVQIMVPVTPLLLYCICRFLGHSFLFVFFSTNITRKLGRYKTGAGKQRDN